MRRGEVWRYDPVVQRAGQPTSRLVVSSDALNGTDGLATVYVMHVVDSDPGSLLAVRIAGHGWAIATAVDRPVRRRLVERLGVAGVEEMELVDSALRATFDL